MILRTQSQGSIVFECLCWIRYLGSKLPYFHWLAQNTPDGRPTINAMEKAEETVGYDDGTPQTNKQPDDSENVACSEKGWTMRVERS